MIRLLAPFLLVALGACASVERVALPRPTLLEPEFAQASDVTRAHIDHSAWNGLLQRHVKADASGVNRVDYRAFSSSDRNRLSRYLQQFQNTDLSTLTRDQQLALWINLYNAATVKVILDNYPVESIRQISDGPLSFGPWDQPAVTVSGRSLTLNDIEHRIIRPIFSEPRIHYALNCAATGCPNLMDRAWIARTLDRDLAAAEHAYVNDPRGVSVSETGALTLSKIYIWFREDFGDSEADVLDRLQSVAEPELAAAIQARGRVARYDYDWSLNETN